MIFCTKSLGRVFFRQGFWCKTILTRCDAPVFPYIYRRVFKIEISKVSGSAFAAENCTGAHSRLLRRQHCSSLCSQSEGSEYCGGQTQTKNPTKSCPRALVMFATYSWPSLCEQSELQCWRRNRRLCGPAQTPQFSNLNISIFPYPTPKNKKSGYAHVGAWRSRIIYDCLSKRALRCVGNGKRGGLSVGDE